MGLTRDAKDWTKLILYNWLFGIRQPGKWQTMTLKNVPVAPVEELLMRWAGGSVWRGGPQKMPWHPRCAGLRHYRGEQPIDDRALDLDNINQWPLEKGQLFWCGPIVDHFGHQLGEFGGRVLLASLDPRPGELLFIHPEGDKSLEELIPWQKSWIRYLNVRNKPVQIRGGKFRAKELIVVPQQQRLGCPPTLKHLIALNKLRKERVIEEIVVFSRSNYASGKSEASLRGSIAGEEAFDEWMEKKGARIIYPETLHFDEQISILRKYRHIIIAEGSALHALELCGREPNRTITVIARRPLWKGMERPIRCRFPQLLWIDAVEEIHWQPPSNPRVKGLAKVDWRKITGELQRRFGWSIKPEEMKKLEDSSKQQLEDLHKTEK